MYSAIELSKYIVSKCVNDDCPISNLQLQKILYFIQKEYLKSKGDVVFSDDIEAWQFGPVVPNVYYEFCGYGTMKISSCYSYEDLKIEDIEIVDRIVDDRRSQNPWDMVDETHKPNGAWDIIYRNGQGNHRVIPVDLIKECG